jgi:hypothetical protein
LGFRRISQLLAGVKMALETVSAIPCHPMPSGYLQSAPELLGAEIPTAFSLQSHQDQSH